MTTEEAADLASVLANEARVRVLQRLLQSGARGMVVRDIQKSVKIPGSTLSHHLQRLREARLVMIRREGTFLWYLPDPDRLRALADMLLGLAKGLGPTLTEETAFSPPSTAYDLEIEAD